MLDILLLGATWACLVANALIVIAKGARAEFVLANVRDVGLSPGIVPLLAVLEGAGVAGVGLGLWRYPAVGLAAALGLGGFFVVAIGAHVRARLLTTIGFPAIFLLLAALAVWHFAAAVSGSSR